MHTLFLGNLPFSITEDSLRELFRRTRVDVISVEVCRGGIAFAHCPDQNSADRAIEVLNGKSIFGFPLSSEMKRYVFRISILGRSDSGRTVDASA